MLHVTVRRTARLLIILLYYQPDSTQIVGRLMQIRDYIKQATSMMDGLKRSTDQVRRSTYYTMVFP